MESWKEQFKAELDICDQLLKIASELPVRYARPSSKYESLLLAFYAKAFNGFHAIVILCRAGRGLAAWPILRSLFEDIVNLSYISLSPDSRATLYLEHQHVEKKLMHEDLESLELPGYDQLQERSRSEAEWWSEYQRVKRNYPAELTWDHYVDDKGNKKPMSMVHMVECVCRETGSVKLKDNYRLIYNYGSKFVHATITGLSSYLTEHDDGSVTLDIDPGPKEIDSMLSTSFALTIIVIREAVSKLSPEFLPIIEELDKTGQGIFISKPRIENYGD